VRNHKHVLAALTTLFIGLTTIAGCTPTVSSASASAYPVVREESFTAHTSDGLTLASHAYGDPHNPEIVFIHGLGQSHLSWDRQVHSDLAERFRIITYDLRGHSPFYESPRRFNRELSELIAGVATISSTP